MAAELTAQDDARTTETTTATFRADVLEASLRQPVLVDFWAPWCEPCKQLAPALERAVKAAGGRVKLVKMNIDQDPEIAGQLGVKSIPAVVAFQRGRPADGFVGSLPENQIQRLYRTTRRTARGRGNRRLDRRGVDRRQASSRPPRRYLLRARRRGPRPSRKRRADSSASMWSRTVSPTRGAARRPACPVGADPAGRGGGRGAGECSSPPPISARSTSLQKRVAFDPNDLQARFDLALALNARRQARGSRRRAP